MLAQPTHVPPGVPGAIVMPDRDLSRGRRQKYLAAVWPQHLDLIGPIAAPVAVDRSWAANSGASADELTGRQRSMAGRCMHQSASRFSMITT